MQRYAREAKDPELESWVSEIRVRAKRRIGELSATLGTGRERGGDGCLRSNDGTQGKRAILTAAGLSATEAHRCERIAAIPAATFDAFIAAARERGKAITGEMVERMVAKSVRKTEVVQKAASD